MLYCFPSHKVIISPAFKENIIAITILVTLINNVASFIIFFRSSFVLFLHRAGKTVLAIVVGNISNFEIASAGAIYNEALAGPTAFDKINRSIFVSNGLIILLILAHPPKLNSAFVLLRLKSIVSLLFLKTKNTLKRAPTILAITNPKVALSKPTFP